MSKFRFLITDKDGNQVATTEWTDEFRNGDAPQALIQVRQQYGGDLRYRIEREGLENKPNPITYTRYVIKTTTNHGDALNYSRLLRAEEKEAALAEIRQLFPGAEISAQEVTQ